MKTASRILGTAFFRAGYEVQDAPRYGAERRGAPIFAFVRADHAPVQERGIIRNPDLVLVADDSLVAVPAAGVLEGVGADTVLLIYSDTDADTWRERLNTPATVLVIPIGTAPVDPLERRYAGASCAGAAARLTGAIPLATLERAISEELVDLDPEVIGHNLQHAREAWELMAPQEGRVRPGAAVAASGYTDPAWVTLPLDAARVAAPTIHGSLTSEQVRTGLWRTMRPVIDYSLCNRCWWVCSTFCPDGAISVTAGRYPLIDYDHCKGCMVCVTQCPPHAIVATPEIVARGQAMEAPPS